MPLPPDYLKRIPRPSTIPINLDPHYAPYHFGEAERPAGWGKNVKVYPFKSLLIYTTILVDNKPLQAAIREYLQIRMPCELFKTKLFVCHLNGTIFYRPSIKTTSAVELSVVEDPAGAPDFIELSINGVSFGFMDPH